MQGVQHLPLYRWEKFHGNLPANTVYADADYAVVKGHHGGDEIVGKYSTKYHKAYVPYGGKEVEIAGNDFEVLVHAPGTHVKWVPASHGGIADGAVGPVGKEGVFVGRANCPHPENKPTPGKVHPKYKKFYLPWGGKENEMDHHEVCVIVHDWAHYTNTVYNWEKFNGSLPANTVYADADYAVCKAHFHGDEVIGKYSTKYHKGYLPWGGKENEVNGQECEILVHAPGTVVEWVHCSHGSLPAHAVGPIGKEGLFVGRAVCPHPENKPTPGKIHPGYKKFYLPWGGKENEHDSYDALVIRWNW